MPRALVIDDNDANREIVTALLRARGIDVDSARDGAEAIALARESPPDLAITDLLMPVMDGFTLLREWRADPRLASVPIVVYSATYTEPQDIRLALDLGASAFLVKPMEPKLFVERIGEILDRGVPAMDEAMAEPDEVVLLERYNAALVRKLERRAAQLEQAHRELHEAHERLEFAVAAGRIGLWSWDFRTERVEYSAEWKRQLGYEDQEIANTFSEWECRLHPEDRDEALATVEHYLDGDDDAYESRFRLRHRDGAYRHVLARGTAVRDEHGERTRLLGSHVDLTEYDQLQAQLFQAQKLESVGRLAGGIAHDFNNLLTLILSSTDFVLAELPAGSPLREDLEEIRRAGERAAALTKRLLAFSRKQIASPKLIHLDELIREMKPMLRRLIGEDIELVFEAEGQLGTVRADWGQLEQVIVNLAVNAQDAMPTGGRLTISVAEVESGKAGPSSDAGTGRWVRLRVEDTGTGMDAATRARIFEPFFTTKEPGKGTGLGLSTVHEIIRQCGGQIRVESEPGRGTSFSIEIPCFDGEAEPRLPVPTPAMLRGREAILLVEDDEALQRVTRRVLGAVGYHVLTAQNAADALRILARSEEKIDLLLTDVVMPGMSGVELASRALRERPTLRVLYTSGYAENEALRRGIADGRMPFLAKPYSVIELTRRIREVLDA